MAVCSRVSFSSFIDLKAEQVVVNGTLSINLAGGSLEDFCLFSSSNLMGDFLSITVTGDPSSCATATTERRGNDYFVIFESTTCSSGETLSIIIALLPK